jgi:hypothetical protein
LFWVASYHDGSFACPAGGVPHFLVGDFPVFGLVGGQEVIQGLHGQRALSMFRVPDSEQAVTGAAPQ